MFSTRGLCDRLSAWMLSQSIVNGGTSMRPRTYLLSFIIAQLLVGCSPHAERTRHRFEIQTIEGVVTATNSGGPKYLGQLFHYEEIQRLRLKEDPDNEESLLFRPMHIIREKNGYLFVNDSGNHRVAVFDQEGNFVRGIGRSGQGPGEFQNISGISVDTGILHIFDNRSLRLTKYRTDGSLIDVISLNQTAQALQIDFLHTAIPIAGGSIILIGQERESTSEYVYSWRSVAVIDSSLEVEWQTETPRHKSQTWGLIGGTRALGVLIPYRPYPSIDYHDKHGIVINPADEPILLLHNLDGTLRKQIRLDIEPRPITDEDKARYLDSFDERIANASDRAEEQLRSMKEGTEFPERWPYWGGVSIDDYSYIWIGVTEREEDREAAGGDYLQMILCPEGEYLGDARLPGGSISSGQLTRTETDEETNELILIVYQLHPAVGGFTYP